MSILQELNEIRLDMGDILDRLSSVAEMNMDDRLSNTLSEVIANMTIATTSDHEYVSYVKSIDDAILLAKSSYDRNKLVERDKLIKLYTPEGESVHYDDIADYFNPAGIAEIRSLTLIPAVKLVRTITGYGLKESHAFVMSIKV